MLSSQVVANTILMLSFNERIPVSPMKLQKLLYFTYKDYLKETDEKMFTDIFERWQYGPVISSIYYEFSSFGAKPINKFARDSAGNVTVVNLADNTSAAKSIKKTWNQYKNYSGPELSTLTHKNGSAWFCANEESRCTLKDEDIKDEPDYR